MHPLLCCNRLGYITYIGMYACTYMCMSFLTFIYSSLATKLNAGRGNLQAHLQFPFCLHVSTFGMF